MKTVSIHDAKSNLSKYINAAKKGEKVYIGGYGKPEVALVKIGYTHTKSQRNFKALEGMVKEKSDSFSSDTEKQVSDLLYGQK